jgi:transglutaminase-like putative cysteine protease
LAAALSCILLFNNGLKAQNFESLQKQFPGEKAVLLNKSLQYNINIKNGQPYVESHETQQIEYLLGTATAYMGQYGFSHSDFQKLLTYEAYTRTPNDKKLKVSEFKTITDKEDFVFYDDVKETTFNFPAVEPGAIGNLDVSWHNTDPHLLSPYYFTNYMPAVNSELKLTVSKDISLKYKLIGLDTNNITVTVDNKHSGTVYTFQYKNCPSDKRYPDAPEFAWYSPHVIFYIENYKDDKGNVVPYLSNTNDLYKLQYGFIKTVNTTIDPGLKHIVDSLTLKLTTPESKAKSIYSWVQHNIKYVAFEDGMGGFVPRDAGMVCSRRFGDCKDMASILTEMMTAAKIPAYFTWIGTRDLPYKFSNVPLPLVSNHMICAIKLNGEFIFLDGTDPTCVFGLTPSGIQDKEAMIGISENEFKIVKVPVIAKEKNTVADTTWMELTKDGIKGKIKRDLRGYYAMNTYGHMMYWKDKDMKENMKDNFERGSNKFKLDTFKIEKKETNNEIVLNGEFTLPDYAKKLGTEYYLNLNLFKFFQNEQIDYPKRKMPIEHDFKWVRKYITMLKIPEGYKVTYLPQSKSFHNKVWGFEMQYTQKGNWITLTQEFDNESLMLDNDQFEQWNKVLENLLPLYKETLSLSQN